MMEIYFLETIPKTFNPGKDHSIVALNPMVAYSLQMFGGGEYRFLTPDQLVYPEDVQIEMVKKDIEEFYGSNCIFFQTAADVNRAEIYWGQFLLVYLRAILEYYNHKEQVLFNLEEVLMKVKIHYYCSHPPMYPVFHELIRKYIFDKELTGKYS